MTKDFYFNTAKALDKAKADRGKPVTPVEYKFAISDVGSDSNMLWPDTMYGLLPKGTGKITLHESKPAPVQVSPLEFVTMVMEREHLVGKPLFWAEWPNKENT
jgi:hypothetical protein